MQLGAVPIDLVTSRDSSRVSVLLVDGADTTLVIDDFIGGLEVRGRKTKLRVGVIYSV